MKSQDDLFYQALSARDPRFDGKFFTGVKTTGIYCRPICPAKPKRENVEFFASAAAAEKNGYRPCLRCRPESAPQSAAWIGKSAVVRRALKLITTQGLVELNEDEFSARLGMSARHLRRLFDEELGKSPKQISDHQRLDFARKLVLETPLPITDIAFTSGFGSIRRFNDSFLKRFHRAPNKLRKTKSKENKISSIELSLSFRPPFSWKDLSAFYQSHQITGVETVDEESYQRVFRLDDQVGAFRVEPDFKNSLLQLKIATTDPKQLFVVAQRVRAMFDLDSDPVLIGNSLANCTVLSKLYAAEPGLRLPRAWDIFESVIATVLGQLVSVAQGKRLLRDLVKSYGEKIVNPLDGTEAHLFPTADVLSTASLAEIGTTQIRKNTIREIATRVKNKELNLDPTQDTLEFKKSLLEIKGVGEWTAEYIRLRSIGDPDAFPHTDLILKRALEAEPSIQLDDFRPWRGYAAMYLWKHAVAQAKLKTKAGKKK